jgi:hypothetical protein
VDGDQTVVVQMAVHRFGTPRPWAMLRCKLLFASIIMGIVVLAQNPPTEVEARTAMDAFMTAFNSRDARAWAATLNYPHVRLASGEVRVYKTADEFTTEMRDYWKRLAPWHHSKWDSMNAIQSGPDKVHFAVTFVRYEAGGKEISRFPSLYVVTLQNGHWGVQARSSFAP